MIRVKILYKYILIKKGNNMYIARQPIFDSNLNIYGYELLFRADTKHNQYEGISPESSTATVLGGLYELGIENLVGYSKAFVNFNEKLLFSDSIELIKPETLIIEITEDVVIDDNLMNKVDELKVKNYLIALDDFVEKYNNYPLVSKADIIKYDIIATPLNTIEKDVKKALKEGKTLLAEKIETIEEFVIAKNMGFHLFQGFFFRKPSIVGGIKNKKALNATYQRIISELHNDEPSIDSLADIISTDINLAYRIMRVKSQNNQEPKKTIKNALIKMGLMEFERWINILMLQDLSDDKPLELIRLSLVRSKFGELIARKSIYARRANEISLLFLFSVIDAMTDQPMEEALKDISICEDAKEVLICHEGNLSPIYQIINGYENGNWEQIKDISHNIQIDETIIYSMYIEAIDWAENIMKTI